MSLFSFYLLCSFPIVYWIFFRIFTFSAAGKQGDGPFASRQPPQPVAELPLEIVMAAVALAELLKLQGYYNACAAITLPNIKSGE